MRGLEWKVLREGIRRRLVTHEALDDAVLERMEGDDDQSPARYLREASDQEKAGARVLASARQFAAVG